MGYFIYGQFRILEVSSTQKQTHYIGVAMSPLNREFYLAQQERVESNIRYYLKMGMRSTICVAVCVLILFKLLLWFEQFWYVNAIEIILMIACCVSFSFAFRYVWLLSYATAELDEIKQKLMRI